jgi:hypothetical protein
MATPLHTDWFLATVQDEPESDQAWTGHRLAAWFSRLPFHLAARPAIAA